MLFDRHRKSEQIFMNHHPTWHKNKNRKKSKKSLKQARPDDENGLRAVTNATTDPEAPACQGDQRLLLTQVHVGQLGHPPSRTSRYLG